MKTEKYRHAVRSVRWTDEQRMTIEARLSVPLHHPEDIEDGYTDTVTAISTVLPREEKKMEIKTKKSKKKIWMIAALAAALSVGGVTAGIAMRGQNKNGETVIQDESHPDNLTTDKPEFEELKSLGLHLSGADSIPGTKHNPYNNYIETENENGWYHVLNSKQYGTRSVLCYTDKESGETVPLCTNPGCKHDGNLYCTASTKAYSGGSLCWADGALWRGSMKNMHPEQDMQLADFSDAHAVLLQYAPDGSSIKEVADFGVGSISKVIYHRGCLFFFVKRQLGESTLIYNEMTKQEQPVVTAGYDLIAYDLTAKKTVTLLSRMPEAGSGIEYTVPLDYWCAGEYVYFELNAPKWTDPYKKGFYRVSMLTGKVEPVLEGEQYYVYSISQNDLLYSRPAADNPTQTETALMHLDTLSSEVLTDFNVTSDPAVPTIMDDNYFYAQYYNPEKETYFVEIHEKTGKKVGEAALPKNQYLCYLAVNGDRMFAVMQGTITTKNGQGYTEMNTNAYLRECSIKDVLNGNTEWKTVYCLDDTYDGGNDDAK